jgi:hypothetical protein
MHTWKKNYASPFDGISSIFLCVRLFIYYYLSRVGGGVPVPSQVSPSLPRVCQSPQRLHVTSKRTNNERKKRQHFPTFSPQKLLDFFTFLHDRQMQLFGCVFFWSLSIGRWRVHITPRPFSFYIMYAMHSAFFFSSPKNVYSLFLLFTGFIEYFRVGPPIWHQKKNRDCAGHREKISARYTNLYTYSDGTAAGRLDMHARFNNWTKKKSFFYFGHFLFLFFFSCSFGLIFFVFLIDISPPLFHVYRPVTSATVFSRTKKRKSDDAGNISNLTSTSPCCCCCWTNKSSTTVS